MILSGLGMRFLSKTVRIAVATRSLMKAAGPSGLAPVLGFLASSGFCN